MIPHTDRTSPVATPDALRADKAVMVLPEGFGSPYRPIEAERAYALRRFNRRPRGRAAYRRFFLAKPETYLVFSEGAHGSSLWHFRRTTAKAFRKR